MDRIAASVPIEARFLELDGQTRRLCATRLPTSAELVAHFAHALLPALRDTDVSPDWAYNVARNLAHAAGRVYRGDHLPRWDVSVESSAPALGDPGAARIVTGRFRDVAVLAAHAANVASAGTTDDEAVDAWLDLLKKESPYYDIDFERINSLARASADMCVRLTVQQLGQTSSSAAPPATSLAVFPLAVPAADGASRTTDNAAETDHRVPSSPTIPPAQIDASPPLSLKEAAKSLRVHEDTLRRMWKAGTITMFKVGSQWRVLASEVARVRQLPKFRDR